MRCYVTYGMLLGLPFNIGDVMANVYFLFDRNTKCFYVGSTGELEKRLDRHMRDLRNNQHHNHPLQELWNKYQHMKITWLNFETLEEARVCEQLIIDNNVENDRMLNIGLSTSGGDNLTRNPRRDEIVAKITQTIQDRMSELLPEERRAIWGRKGKLNPMWGRTHTDEVKKKLSDTHKGNEWAKGSKRSKEHRLKLSWHAKQRRGEKNHFFGKAHSEETKRKLSEARKGNKPPNRIAIRIGDQSFESYAEASRALGIPVPTIHYRLKSKNPKYSDYEHISKCPTTSERALGLKEQQVA